MRGLSFFAETAMPVTSASKTVQPDVDRILKLKVPVIVRLAQKKMPVSEIMRLSLGSVLEFDQSVDEPLKLLVNNSVVGEGEAVKVGEKFGLRVTQIGDVHERIDALRG